MTWQYQLTFNVMSFPSLSAQASVGFFLALRSKLFVISLALTVAFLFLHLSIAP